MQKPKMFDPVALTEDIPSEGLVRGNIGAVVEIYNGGESYEVEFVDPQGQTYGMLALRPDQLLLIHRHAMERVAA